MNLIHSKQDPKRRETRQQTREFVFADPVLRDFANEAVAPTRRKGTYEVAELFHFAVKLDRLLDKSPVVKVVHGPVMGMNRTKLNIKLRGAVSPSLGSE